MHNEQHAIWQKAAAFAARAHRNQVRKDCNTPYISHPFRVAMTVRHVFRFDEPELLAAALLHDVIEDTDADYDDVLELFGKNVADLVTLMTKDMRLIEHQREPAYDQQLASGPWQCRLLKLADVYDNLTDAQVGPRSVESMLKKAKRAIALVKHDAELDNARAIVEALVAHCEQSV